MQKGKRNLDLLQFNLALPADAPADLPHEQQTELDLALAELLIRAWTEAAMHLGTGGDHESETNA